MLVFVFNPCWGYTLSSEWRSAVLEQVSVLVWLSLVANPEKLPAILPPPGIPMGKSQSSTANIPMSHSGEMLPSTSRFSTQVTLWRSGTQSWMGPWQTRWASLQKADAHMGTWMPVFSNTKRWSESRTARIWERWKVPTAALQIRFGVDPSDRLMGGFAHVPKQTHVPNHCCYC